MMIEKCHGTAGDETAVSLGYDKVRFLGPVFIGDTVTLTYTITEVDPVKRRSRSEIKIVNQNGRTGRRGPAHPGLGQGQGVTRA